jgi:hypothetical protein
MLGKCSIPELYLYPKISFFQNPFNCSTDQHLPTLHLEAIHLQLNDIVSKYLFTSLRACFSCYVVLHNYHPSSREAETVELQFKAILATW